MAKIDELVKLEAEMSMPIKRIPVAKMASKMEPSNDKSSTGVIVEEENYQQATKNVNSYKSMHTGIDVIIDSIDIDNLVNKEGVLKEEGELKEMESEWTLKEDERALKNRDKHGPPKVT